MCGTYLDSNSKKLLKDIFEPYGEMDYGLMISDVLIRVFQRYVFLSPIGDYIYIYLYKEICYNEWEHPAMEVGKSKS